jgi:hypothetical protein
MSGATASGQAAPRAARPWMIATGLAAAVAVVLAIVLATRSTPSSAPSTSAVDSGRSTARLACAILEQIPTAGFDLKGQPVLVDKLGALSELAILAKDLDPSQRALAKKLGAPQQVISFTFSAKGPQFRAALTAARAACAQI